LRTTHAFIGESKRRSVRRGGGAVFDCDANNVLRISNIPRVVTESRGLFKDVTFGHLVVSFSIF
jgi:hypothetical protein